MKSEMRKRILEFNRERAKEKEKAEDLMTLIGALPLGIVRSLFKNEVCAAILKKYGIDEGK